MRSSMPSSLLRESEVNWSIVENMSISLMMRRQKRSNLPKICISLKSNCLPLGMVCSFRLVSRYCSWYASESLRHDSSCRTSSCGSFSQSVSKPSPSVIDALQFTIIWSVMRAKRFVMRSVVE